MKAMGEEGKTWLAGIVFASAALVLWAEPASAGTGSSNQIRDLQVAERGGETTVTVVGSQRPSFTAFKLDSPRRLVIDVANSYVRGVPSVLEKMTAAIRGVAVSEYSVKGVPVSRVMINFREDVAYRIRVQDNDLVISLNGSPGRSQAGATLEDKTRLEMAEAESARKDAEELRDKAKQEAADATKMRSDAEKETETAKKLRSDAEKETEAAKKLRSDAEKETEAAKKLRSDAEKETEAAKKLRTDAERQALEAKSMRDAAEKEAAQANNARDAAEKEAAEAARLRDQAVLEVARAKQLQEKAEAELARVTASGAEKSAASEKRKGEIDSDLNRKLKEKSAQIEKYRDQAEKADALVRQEKEKRLALETKLSSLSSQLETSRSAKKNAEEALAKVAEEAVRLKTQSRENAVALTSAEQDAERALQAQRRAAEDLRRAADSERAKLQVILQQREAEVADARKKLEQKEAEKDRIAGDLAVALADLKAATSQARETAREQQNAELRGQKELAEAGKKRLEAEQATAAAERRAESARAARLAAEQDAARIREAADARVAEARQKAERADGERRAAAERLAAREEDLLRSEEKARSAEERADALVGQLRDSQANVEQAQGRALALAEKLTALEAKLETVETKAATVEKSLSETRQAVAGQSQQIEKNRSALTQEEKRLERMAAMRGEKTALAPAPKPVAQAPQPPKIDPKIEDIQVVAEGEKQKVVISTNERLECSVATDADGNATMTFHGAALPPMLERVLDVTDLKGIVGNVSSYREGDDVFVEVGVARSAANTINREKNRIEWVFAPRTSKPAAAAAEEKLQGTKSRTIAREESETYAYPFERTAGYTLALSDKQKKKTRYTGRHVDLDFKDADIHNILRLLADVGQINIITSDDVKGTVTIRMRNVAWDHALDVILQTKNLGMVRQGNLIRVAPLQVLEKEREMEIARREQQQKLDPIETRLIPISYATASDLQARAADLLTDRGKISVDSRTNVIIARDTVKSLTQIEALLRTLDTQTPQVLIESRIVEASSTYSREIGIQWGGDFMASSATGNPTGLAFPSTLGLAGGSTDSQTPMAGLSPLANGRPNPNFGVNLPAPTGTGSGGALGITLGSISNNANLSIRLSSAEESGSIRILSAPKILTLDNRDATIEQGTQIPYSQVSAMGVQTAFKDAKLSLRVKPHVTADGSILLQVDVARAEPDFANTGARGDPTILTRSAKTELLVSDGHTAVIGGIITRNAGTSFKKVPFFADIPILGWLFKSKADSDRRNELLIFITPRVVNRVESIGQ